VSESLNKELRMNTVVSSEKLDVEIPARLRRPALIVLSGELFAVSIPLERDAVILGRALEADIRINDVRASRLHARITTEHETSTNETRYRITDLDSTNGTLLNGHPITESYLHDGDKILIGEHLMRFDLIDDIDQAFQQQIRRLIVHDQLTGLLTSKSFFSELRREAARSEIVGNPFCVFMMDIDHFKQVNDTYGHLTGSQTLEEVGICVMRSLRAGDVAARFGGEEFAAFLLEADLTQGLVAAERVRTAIEKYPFTVTRTNSSEGPLTHHITISIGIAVFPDDSRDPIELVEFADSALYRAKRDGRNRVCAYNQTANESDKLLPARHG
jgi:diguanylate cyclase (GGDEF)-like protein